jgi:transporter family-2 protein
MRKPERPEAAMLMQAILLTVLAFAAGACIAFQAPLNAAAATALGSPLAGATLSFCVGTLALLVVTTLTVRHQVELAALKTLPLYVLIGGGLLGALYVTASTALTPRIGVAAIMALVISGQLFASLLLDRFGLFGLVERDLTVGRVGGVFVILAGGLMMRFL